MEGSTLFTHWDSLANIETATLDEALATMDDAHPCPSCGQTMLAGTQTDVRLTDKVDTTQRFVADLDLFLCPDCNYIQGRIAARAYLGY